MGKIKDTTIDAGDEVVRAAGELNATVHETVKSVSEIGVDHEEVQGWLTTVFKAVLAALR